MPEDIKMFQSRPDQSIYKERFVMLFYLLSFEKKVLRVLNYVKSNCWVMTLSRKSTKLSKTIKLVL